MFIEPAIRRVMKELLAFPRDGISYTPVPTPSPGHHYYLYIHIPFCERLCPYCSFHRVLYKHAKVAPYFKALEEEIRHYIGLGFQFSEVYVGGGTPTTCIEELGNTLRRLREDAGISRISVETNPNHLNEKVMQVLKDAGINRLSVGVQSFDDDLLKAMDRYRPYGSGEHVARRLQEVTGMFDTVNADMIFNLPRQSRSSLQRDLEVLTDMNIDQVSWYPLMVANSSRRRMRRTMGEPDAANEQRFYHLIREELSKTYSPSTVWTFSRQNHMIDEYIINHHDYVGVGSGAFSYINGSLYSTSFSINRYQDLVDKTGFGISRHRKYTRQWGLRYNLLMDLFGLSIDAGQRAFPHAYLRWRYPELSLLKAAGAIRSTRTGYALTHRGMYLWVILMREFFTGVNNFRDQMRAHIKEEYRLHDTSPAPLQWIS